MLQEDLSTIARWEQDWLMLLNLSKCEHLIITNKRNPINSSYKLNDQILRQVTNPCLGMITSSIFATKQTQLVHSDRESVLMSDR